MFMKECAGISYGKISKAVIALTATAVLIAGLSGSRSNPAYAGTCAAGSLAERAGTAFVKAARSRSSSAFAGALRTHVDMRSVSLFALGRYRKQLPKAREGEFVNLTSSYVARTLASFSAKFRAESIKALRCRGRTVESQLIRLGGGVPQKVLWKIKSGKVRDVNIQNVWLAQLLRSNYSDLLKKNGGNIDGLIAQLGGSGSAQNRSDK
jgi:ABC-type transporter MlaC component